MVTVKGVIIFLFVVAAIVGIVVAIIRSNMRKWIKIVLCVLTGIVVTLMLLFNLFLLIWGGAFNVFFPHDVASFDSPDGSYHLTFQQLGDPGWPFGPADVRLIVTNRYGWTLDRVNTKVYNDGCNANERNIKSVEWNNSTVIVILCGEEQPDETVVLDLRK